MESIPDNAPLIAVVGQTATGKSALALELAEQWGGEIIAADSRTIYRGMDIGTAKPTAMDRARVPHHLLDVFNPDQQCTASDFKRLAEEAVVGITARGKIPFLVGGTGLYVDAFLYNFSFRGAPDMEERQILERLSVDALQERIRQAGLALPANANNPRHLIRTIEARGARSTQHALRSGAVVIGVTVEKEVLSRRIVQRVDTMLAAGLEREVMTLAREYSWNCPPMQTIGYQEFKEYFAGQIDITEVRQRIIANTLRYAKRQQMWFKRNQSIRWISKMEEAVDILTTTLNK